MEQKRIIIRLKRNRETSTFEATTSTATGRFAESDNSATSSKVPKSGTDSQKMPENQLTTKRSYQSEQEGSSSSSKVQRLDQSPDHTRNESSRSRKTKFKVNTLNEDEIFDEMMIHAEKELIKTVEEKERPKEQEVTADDLSSDDDDEKSLSDFTPGILADIMRVWKDRQEEYKVETLRRADGEVLDWDLYLEKPENVAKLPSVSDFKKVPLAEDWETIAIKGVGVEIENPFFDGEEEVYWIGTVVDFAGYKAKVELETFEESRRGPLVWVNFCNSEVRHLGWCKKNGKKLDPAAIAILKGLSPEELKDKLDQFSMRTSIKPNHQECIARLIQKCRTFVPFKTPLNEAVDIDALHQNRVCKVVEEIGDRVTLRYMDSSADSDFDLCLSYRSERLHVFGWSYSVGVHLKGNRGMQRRPFPKSAFPTYPESILIEPGMQLETRHPKRVCRIVGAIVKEVLNYGYFILQTMDEDPKKQTSFPYHVTSPFIFPVGFGKSHGIHVEFKGYSEQKPNLQLQCMPPRPAHKFQVGMKFEAVSIIDCGFISPATIVNIADHMLLMKFDSFKDTDEVFTFWVDTEISDIYPIGYCEMLGLEFTGHVDLDK